MLAVATGGTAAEPRGRYRPVITKAGAMVVFRDVLEDEEDDSPAAAEPDDLEEPAPEPEPDEPAPLPEDDEAAMSLPDEEPEAEPESEPAPSAEPDDEFDLRLVPTDEPADMPESDAPYLPDEDDQAEAVEPGKPELDDKQAQQDDDLTPLWKLDLRISADQTDLPTDVAKDRFKAHGVYHASYVSSRNWAPSYYAWEATGLCYGALLFEETSMERLGYSCGVLQPAVSAVQFCGRFPFLPYLLVAHPQRECVYTLGIPRAGSNAPMSFVFPRFDVKAGLIEGGVWTGLIFLIP